MFYIINHNSYILFATILWISLSSLAIKKMSSPGNYFLIAFLAIIVVAVFFLVRPKQASASSGNFIQNKIGSGDYILLEFQSPY